MKKVFIALAILAAAGVLFYYRFSIERIFRKLPDIAETPVVQTISQDISAPPPLVSQSNNPNSSLTKEGVIAWTNNNRRENGNLPALKENTLLDKAAELKLADLFKQQYFEHVNPQGVGPGDLAKEVGYNFIAEGENLALGNFADDQDLLTAWMNSPGHRANILNPKYQEIGVAVGQGIYQGQKTWIAVQEFGRPASSCPSVDANLMSEINSQQAEIGQMEPQVTALKSQIDSANPQTQSQYDAYNQMVAQYNNLVAIYNNNVDTLKLITNQYNAEVSAFNACLGS
jgi:uncharacterized protein YkwD